MVWIGVWFASIRQKLLGGVGVGVLDCYSLELYMVGANSAI